MGGLGRDPRGTPNLELASMLFRRQSFLLPLVVAALANPALAGLPIVEWDRTVMPEAYPGIYPGIGVPGVRSAAVDAAGDLLVIGNGSGCAFTAKFAASNGDIAWRKEACASAWTTLAVDAQGSVLSAGRTGNRLLVIKHAGPTGETLWRREIPAESAEGLWFRPTALAVDSGGNAYLAGYQDRPDRRGHLYKLAAADGAILWKRDAGPGIGAVAVGASAEVFVGTGSGLSRLRGADGAVEWTLPSEGGAGPFGIHPSGDLVAATVSYVAGARLGEYLSWTLTVKRFDRLTGAMRWRIDRPTTAESSYQTAANALAVDARGDVFVTGALAREMFTMKISGASGEAIWEARRPSAASELHSAWGAGLAIDAAGDALVTGASERYDMAAIPIGDARTLRHSGGTGAVAWSAGHFGPSGFFEAGWDAVSSASATYVVGTKRVAGLGDALRVWKYASGSQPGTSAHGLWWVAPAGSESGAGLFVSQQGEVLFALWFSYEGDGAPLWIAMPALRHWRDSTHLGDAYVVSGPYFGSAFDPSAVRATRIGRAQLTPNPDGTLSIEFPDRRGQALRKTVTRQHFADPVPACRDGDPSAASANYQDLWWAAPAGSESGWGLSLAHQGDTLFGIWFTYAQGGRPMWYVAPKLERTASATYSGTLYRTRGPAYDTEPWNALQVIPTPAGTATVAFSDGLNGRFTYSADGSDGSKPIVRQSFARPASVCQ